jgi:hypothetical protein
MLGLALLAIALLELGPQLLAALTELRVQRALTTDAPPRRPRLTLVTVRLSESADVPHCYTHHHPPRHPTLVVRSRIHSRVGRARRPAHRFAR